MRSLAASVRDYLIITVGLVLYVLGWTVFLIPNNLIGGGASGMSEALVEVKNLKLVDFTITGADVDTNAGALAGSVSGGIVNNVIAINSGSGTDVNISGSASVGGLIGSASNCTVEKCAAV